MTHYCSYFPSLSFLLCPFLFVVIKCCTSNRIFLYSDDYIFLGRSVFTFGQCANISQIFMIQMKQVTLNWWGRDFSIKQTYIPILLILLASSISKISIGHSSKFQVVTIGCFCLVILHVLLMMAEGNRFPIVSYFLSFNL